MELIKKNLRDLLDQYNEGLITEYEFVAKMADEIYNTTAPVLIKLAELITK